jgi:hypothetical protein
MERVCFSETLAPTDESTWRQNPEHHPHRRQNLKSHMHMERKERDERIKKKHQTLSQKLKQFLLGHGYTDKGWSSKFHVSDYVV